MLNGTFKGALLLEPEFNGYQLIFSLVSLYSSGRRTDVGVVATLSCTAAVGLLPASMADCSVVLLK